MYNIDEMIERYNGPMGGTYYNWVIEYKENHEPRKEGTYASYRHIVERLSGNLDGEHPRGMNEFLYCVFDELENHKNAHHLDTTTGRSRTTADNLHQQCGNHEKHAPEVVIGVLR